MFDTVLVANRGEIACRIITALHSLGIRAIAVYSDADADAKHVSMADESLRIGPAPAAQSYLNINHIIEAANASGAQAIHPGYGFLAENAGLARACTENGITFIGPDPRALEIMGDKIRSKNHVGARGVPIVPGANEPGLSDAELISQVADLAYPLLVKPSAGGGGKGMHIVEGQSDLPEVLSRARREAERSFGSGELLIEQLIAAPRHVEVQILADRFGHTIHLGERECSLQRRHQKVIEEAPSPLLDGATRARMGQAAIEVAHSVDYEGAGTVEFIVPTDSPEDFYFMEMNTRLQVEHPVTEMVTGVDIVRWQILIAAGEALGLQQSDVSFTGHALEARVYAENPALGFLPTGGRVLELSEPHGEGIRVDSALVPGLEVTADYDPMLAKIIAHGATREVALHRLASALAHTHILGVGTNVEFLRTLVEHPTVRAAQADTEFIDRTEFDFATPDVHALAAVALVFLDTEAPAPGAGPQRWQARDGWGIGGAAATRLTLDGHPPIDVAGPVTGAVVVINDNPSVPARMRGAGPQRLITVSGVTLPYTFSRIGNTVYLARQGVTWEFTKIRASDRLEALVGQIDPHLRSPMPGTIVAVPARDGEQVDEGAPIVAVEAMKMEHVLRAPHAGTVTIHVTAGEQVGAKQVLATVTPQTMEEPSD